ncbi:hypothetical protein BS78_10G215200 [Paspalum vaginatum]|nr:hypothetical protein BS78_10G215200 [Paspalum vaginatum]
MNLLLPDPSPAARGPFSPLPGSLRPAYLILSLLSQKKKILSSRKTSSALQRATAAAGPPRRLLPARAIVAAGPPHRLIPAQASAAARPPHRLLGTCERRRWAAPAPLPRLGRAPPRGLPGASSPARRPLPRRDLMRMQRCSVHVEIGLNEDVGDQSSKIDLWNRKITMGRDLDRISRCLCTKLLVEIVEGKRRPLVPLQAAKLASEAGITLRQHFPILPRWKDYKDDKDLLKEYIGRLGAQFNMDTNSEPVKAACYDLLKCAQRQVRYKLKMAYFNGIPANEVRTTSPLDSTSDEQWQALVDMWSEPKHKNKCVKAKSSRENVQFQQKTGSRSYIAHCHAVKQKKYKDVPPTAIDLFKECHCSSKTSFTETVKDVIANMESINADPIQEGQSSKTPIEVISQVMPKSKFLQNIGLESSAPKRSGKTVVSACVEELEAQLEAKKQCSLNLKGTLDSLMQKVDESEVARVKQLEEFENLKNSHNETTALLRRLIGFNTLSSSQPW